MLILHFLDKKPSKDATFLHYFLFLVGCVIDSLELDTIFLNTKNLNIHSLDSDDRWYVINLVYLQILPCNVMLNLSKLSCFTFNCILFCPSYLIFMHFCDKDSIQISRINAAIVIVFITS